jgi:hypothetical protein
MSNASNKGRAYDLDSWVLWWRTHIWAGDGVDDVLGETNFLSGDEQLNGPLDSTAKRQSVEIAIS